LFCYCQRVIDFDAEVADRALDLRVAEQKLHGPQVAGAPVDQDRLRPPERVGAEQLGIQRDAGEPIERRAARIGAGSCPLRPLPVNRNSPGFSRR
jgi:hypothetical protein